MTLPSCLAAPQILADQQPADLLRPGDVFMHHKHLFDALDVEHDGMFVVITTSLDVGAARLLIFAHESVCVVGHLAC